jgi:hypothetical protein
MTGKNDKRVKWQQLVEKSQTNESSCEVWTVILKHKNVAICFP